MAAQSHALDAAHLERECPLVPIIDDVGYRRAIAVVDRLTDLPGEIDALPEPLGRYLDALSDLVWAYEDAHYPIAEDAWPA